MNTARLNTEGRDLTSLSSVRGRRPCAQRFDLSLQLEHSQVVERSGCTGGKCTKGLHFIRIEIEFRVVRTIHCDSCKLVTQHDGYCDARPSRALREICVCPTRVVNAHRRR